jgi:2-keto-4-pentenoate hydratase/2-oxohepta-3-ene-1,7-dioic acid hydratase in catechol pathway
VKIVVFGAEQRVGAWVGDTIVDLNRAFARVQNQETADERVPSRLEAFIGQGDAALEAAQRAIEHAASSGPDGAVVLRVGDVKLHAPWPGRRIACAGGNFAEHLAGMEGAGASIEDVARRARERGQWGFWKVPDVVAAPDDEIPYPSRTRYFDYEGEPAIVLGKRGKNISASKIDEYVWGVTLANDWSIRDGSAPQRPMSYNQAKNFDMSTSLGPCIVVGELRHDDVPVELKVNGALRQSFNSEDMVFPFGEILEFLSQDFTFIPGDVISGGTNAGTAQDKSERRPDGTKAPDLFLKVGDVVEVSSPKIGTLRNRIVQG